jgi:CRISPR-associated protein Cst2
MILNSLSLCARVTLDMHSLNNEGTEGNQQQTRMVHIIDQKGQRAVVNAVSGDMFKHMLVEHLIPLLQESKQPLSSGAAVGDADRINRDLLGLMQTTKALKCFCKEELSWLDQAVKSLSKGATETEDPGSSDEEPEATDEEKEEGKQKKPKVVPPSQHILASMLSMCALTDITGTLMTMKKPGLSLGRKSVVEFGWVVGLPAQGDGTPLTTTEQYFHVKYAEGRAAATGGESVAGRQAIFHRPASSGVYALICNLDLYRVGLNDITRKYAVSKSDREKRAKALIHALAATLVKPTGAQRNTQNPHIVACEGIVATSATSLPSPTVSPLNDNYRDQMDQVVGVLNGIAPNATTAVRFDTLADGIRALAEIARQVELSGE